MADTWRVNYTEEPVVPTTIATTVNDTTDDFSLNTVLSPTKPPDHIVSPVTWITPEEAEAFHWSYRPVYYISWLVQWAWICFLGALGDYVAPRILPRWALVECNHGTIYLYAGVRIYHPIWVRYFTHYMKLVLLFMCAMVLIFWMIMPAIGTLQLHAMRYDVKAIRFSAPLTASEVQLYLFEYKTAQQVAQISIEILVRVMDKLSMNSTDVFSNEAAPRPVILADDDEDMRRLQEDLDHDGVPDMFNVKSTHMVQATLPSLANNVNALRILFAQISSQTTEENQIGDSSQGSVSLYPKAVLPIVPEPELLCEFIPQLTPRGTFVLRHGCWDMIPLMLDMQFNVGHAIKLFAEKSQDTDVLIGNQYQNQAMKAVKERDEREKSNQQRRYNAEGQSKHDCVCNAHYGVAQLFAYSSAEDHAPEFLIAYTPVPISVDNIHAPEAQHVQVEFDYIQRRDGVLYETDKALRAALNITGRLLCPEQSASFSGKVLSTHSSSSFFYGPHYSKPSKAFMICLAKAIELRNQETQQGNVISRYLESMADPEVLLEHNEDVAGHCIFTERTRMSNTFYPLVKEAEYLDAQRDASTFGSILKLIGAGGGSRQHITGNSHMDQEVDKGLTEQQRQARLRLSTYDLPENKELRQQLLQYRHPKLLEQVKTYTQMRHISCFTYCLTLHNTLNNHRQARYNLDQGFSQPRWQQDILAYTPIFVHQRSIVESKYDDKP